MTAALHALITDPFAWFIAALIVVTCWIVAACDRADAIDEHTRQHRESDECPWCAASDERLLEHERQQWRADIAKRNREAAERRMRGAS